MISAVTFLRLAINGSFLSLLSVLLEVCPSDRLLLPLVYSSAVFLLSVSLNFALILVCFLRLVSRCLWFFFWVLGMRTQSMDSTPGLLCRAGTPCCARLTALTWGPRVPMHRIFMAFQLHFLEASSLAQG